MSNASSWRGIGKPARSKWSRPRSRSTSTDGSTSSRSENAETRSAIIGSVAPACGTMISMSGAARDRAVEHEVHDRAGGVEQELEHRSRPPERRVLPARRRSRVEEDPGPAPVELGEHRLPRRVAEVRAADVGEQHESVDVQLVVAVRDLGDRAVDVGQRERAEQPEASGMVDDRPAARPRSPRGPGRGAATRRRGERPATRPTGARSRSPAGPSPRTCSAADHAGISGKPSGCAWPACCSASPVEVGKVVRVDVDLAGGDHDGPLIGAKSKRHTASAWASITSSDSGSRPLSRRHSGASTNIVGPAPVRM